MSGRVPWGSHAVNNFCYLRRGAIIGRRESLTYSAAFAVPESSYERASST